MFVPTPTATVPSTSPRAQGNASQAFLSASQSPVTARSTKNTAGGHTRSSSMFVPTPVSTFIPRMPSVTPPPVMPSLVPAAPAPVAPVAPVAVPVVAPVAVPVVAPQPEAKPVAPLPAPVPVASDPKPSASMLFASKQVSATAAARAPSRPKQAAVPSVPAGVSLFVPGASVPGAAQQPSAASSGFRPAVPKPPAVMTFLPPPAAVVPAPPLDTSSEPSLPAESPAASSSAAPSTASVAAPEPAVALSPPPLVPAAQTAAPMPMPMPRAYHHRPLAGGDDGAQRPPHPVACIGFGGRVVTVFPPRGYGTTGTLYLHGTVAQLAPEHASVAPLRRFPGPLVRSSRDAVLAFVKDEAERAMGAGGGAAGSEPQKAQVEQSLLWQIVGLLCRHYGALDARAEGVQELSALLLVYSSRDRPAAAVRPQTDAVAPDVYDELRRLLCAGAKVDALRCACAHGCWPLALALAPQISPKCAADTTAAFARACMPDGDPLRTFLLCAAAQPAEALRTPCVVDRWLENVAMLLANRTPATRGLVGDLGDRLWQARPTAAAAHVCYLVADSAFGYADNPSTRLVLVGADHKRARAHYVTPAAVQATECYEYAKTQGNPQFSLPCFQPYKLVYAHWLADAGLVADAERYVRALRDAVRPVERQLSPLVLAQIAELQARLAGHTKGLGGGGAPLGGLAGSGSGAALGTGAGGFFSSLTSRLFGESSSSSSSGSGSATPRAAAPAPAPAAAPATTTTTTPDTGKTHEAAASHGGKHEGGRQSGRRSQTPGWLSRLWGGRKVINLKEDEELVFDETVHRWVTPAEQEAIRNGTAPVTQRQSASERFLAASARPHGSASTSPVPEQPSAAAPAVPAVPTVPAAAVPEPALQPSASAPLMHSVPSASCSPAPPAHRASDTAASMVAPPSRRRGHRPSFTPAPPALTPAFTPAATPATAAPTAVGAAGAPSFFVPAAASTPATATPMAAQPAEGPAAGSPAPNPYAQFFAPAPPAPVEEPEPEPAHPSSPHAPSDSADGAAAPAADEEDYDPFA